MVVARTFHPFLLTPALALALAACTHSSPSLSLSPTHPIGQSPRFSHWRTLARDPLPPAPAHITPDSFSVWADQCVLRIAFADEYILGFDRIARRVRDTERVECISARLVQLRALARVLHDRLHPLPDDPAALARLESSVRAICDRVDLIARETELCVGEELYAGP